MLPKHNGVLRTFYGLLTLVMFAFMILLVRHYANATQANAANVSSEVQSQSGQWFEPFYVSGKQYTLDLKTDTEKQLNELWQRFATDEPSQYLTSIRESDKVHLAFGRYDETAMSVKVVMGYATTKQELLGQGYESLMIPKGQYLAVDSVLTQWQNPTAQSQNQLSYRGDHEVYQLNENYQVVNKQAFVGLKE